MGSRTFTSIVRQDIDGKDLEASKCIYQHCGYSDGTNVLTLLAFFNDGRYFASLPKEVQNRIGEACFKYQPNLYSLKEIDFFSPNACGVADVVLYQRGKEITAGVVAETDHIAFLMGLENEEKIYTLYERFSDDVLIPIDEYYSLLNSSDLKRNSMQQFVDDFIKTYNIKMITANELNALDKINKFSPEFSDENLEKTLRIYNTLVSQYSRYCENDKTDEYQREREEYQRETYGYQREVINVREDSQFQTAEEVKKYPMDNELLDILKDDKQQNQMKVRKKR